MCEPCSRRTRYGGERAMSHGTGILPGALGSLNTTLFLIAGAEVSPIRSRDPEREFAGAPARRYS
ncbi:hypothetical protein GCM10011588_63770 [Nocardia jinanensis]|uniref:Uncharacterized protein n=1 Tax=Nocardia jinanensis TaxID=382504 RepID=A0A917RWF7_9NOCA|nr:hypothetical protein GCM10011588_63770 [Nocardia jinanensis]